MLTIIAAMEQELAGLRRCLAVPPAGGGTSLKTDPERPVPLDCQVVGVGGARSQRKLEALLRPNSRRVPAGADEPQSVLLLGFAGGLDPDLAPGDLVLSSRYYRTSYRQGPSPHPFRRAGPPGLVSPDPPSNPGDSATHGFLTADPVMWRRALGAAERAGMPAWCRDSLAVDRPVTTPSAKASLRRRYPVGVVNMEDYWLAAAAGEAGVPFLSVRAVLDTAHQTLPGGILALSQARPSSVLGIAAMPWRIPPLWRLARQMRLAQQALARFALSYVEEKLNRGGVLANPAAVSAPG